MKKDFKESNIKAKIIREAFNTWMCCWSQGVGELESVSQGRFKEAGTEIQYQPKIGHVPSLLPRVQDARPFLTHLPFFIFSSGISL